MELGEVWSRVGEVWYGFGGGLVWDGKVSSGVGVVVGRCDLGLGSCGMELGKVWSRVGEV